MEDGPATIRPHRCRGLTPRARPQIPPQIGHCTTVYCVGHPRSPRTTEPGTRLPVPPPQATRGRGYPLRLGARCREQPHDDADTNATPERLCLLCRSLSPGASPARLASTASVFATVSDISHLITQATVSGL
ncbi:uncharacterized protein CC84DRAFT_273428 [Paraphaeosphaeria sporulosa]|uniref:Uncharacterized protein n=1 Tax=Paraphaeosphaeria sporulosa TaxID=1460663 RepID=A0A177C2I3_9PLEO|nr:uncharacterized protein CC84DRAFT_273428 [Paraphaeosphaeria sporulosa]OAG00947.1 hypothetical protein CC84DRAFT_273428 [Paraphaeosphaeria sporulosa]